MKSEKGTNRLTGEQIRSRKNSRIIIRILGLSIAIFGIFAFIGFVNSPVFGPSSTGTWIYLLTALLFGGGLFALSFFVPKLYLPYEPEKTQPADPCPDKNAPAEAPNIEGTVLSFHTDAGEQMTFRLVAVQRISGVPGSTMVEAHSTWIFFSYMGETPYLLEYDYSSEWYPEWLAISITQKDVQKIKQGPQQNAQKEFAAYWLWHGIMLDRRKDKGRLSFLNLDDIEAAKRVLYPLQTWHGKLTDEDILGGGPLDLPAAEHKKETDG